MRVHPERAAEAQGEVVVRAAARRNRGSGNPRHAVLPPRRRQPMPMDKARFVDAVFDPNAKRLAHLGRDAKGPVRLPDAVDRRHPAVDLDVAPLKPQDRRRRSGAVVEFCARARIAGAAKARNAARKKCASGQHGKPHQESGRMDTTNSPFGVERVAIGDCRRMTEARATRRRLVHPDGSARRRTLNGARAVGRASFPRARSLAAIDFTPFLTHF